MLLGEFGVAWAQGWRDYHIGDSGRVAVVGAKHHLVQRGRIPYYFTTRASELFCLLLLDLLLLLLEELFVFLVCCKCEIFEHILLVVRNDF